MTRYLIIDDEPIAHRIIEGYAKNLPQLTKVGNCYNALEALNMLQNKTVDIMFLDINMPQLTGFELIKTLPSVPKVIVTTAYQEYAIEGYELEVTDYLLKPFSLERFLKAINKVIIPDQSSNTAKTLETERVQESIFIKEDRRLSKVRIDEILYIEAYGNYSKVFLNERMIITPEKISVLHGLLPERQFLRTHKSFVIATNHIDALEGNKIAIGDKYIPIGQTYSKAVKDFLK